MTRPQYRRIADRLRAAIHAGKWQPGDRLPSLAALSDHFGVSVAPVRQAVQELVRENLLYTATSRGTIVRSQQVLDHVVTDAIRPDRPRRSAADEFVETAARAGRFAEMQFEMQIEPASDEVAGWLALEPQTWVVARSLLHYLDGEPWSWELTHIPRDVAEATGTDAPRDIAEGTMQRLADCGYREIAFTTLDRARPASPEEADRLGLAQGTWITDFVRISATTKRVTRVVRRRWVADRNRVIAEFGDDAGLQLIRNALNRGNEDTA